MPPTTTTIQPERTGQQPDQDVQAVLATIEAQLGSAIVTSPNGDATTPPAVIGTGNLALDHALGVGGIPRGRITEIYGPEGVGKTTLALSVLANAQRTGGRGLFIDAEHALDLG
jgi:recombination protein RecA